MSKRFLVFGDSIAAGFSDPGLGWVLRLKRYIDQKYYFNTGEYYSTYNLSNSGETIGMLNKRLAVELANFHDREGRTIIFIASGVNDTNSYNHFGRVTPPVDFEHIYNMILDKCLKYSKSTEVYSIGLLPVSEKILRKGEGVAGDQIAFKNDIIREYDSIIKNAAKNNDIKYIDLWDEFWGINAGEDSEEAAEEEDGDTSLYYDALHPNSKGHKIIYEKILQLLKEDRHIG